MAKYIIDIWNETATNQAGGYEWFFNIFLGGEKIYNGARFSVSKEDAIKQAKIWIDKRERLIRLKAGEARETIEYDTDEI